MGDVNGKISEFAKLELDISINAFRAQYDLLTKIVTVLLIADVSFIGYAIKEETALFALLALVFPVGIFFTIFILRRAMLATIYVAINIERKYGGDEHDWLATTYISFLASTDFIEKLTNINEIENREDRIKQLKKIGSIEYTGSSRFVMILAISVIVCHAILPYILYLSFTNALF